MVQEEAGHGLGEALVVGEVDVEVPEPRDEVLSGSVHDLGGRDGFVRPLHSCDPAFMHENGLGFPGSVRGVDDRDVPNGQVGRWLRGRA